MKNVLLLNGPNLAMLGQREPELYGTTTLKQIEGQCFEAAQRLQMQLQARQSNHEGELVGWLNAAYGHLNGVIINPGGLSHSSVSLRDALAMLGIPIIEVHLTNIQAREPFRHHSLISGIATGVVAGFGAHGYLMAIDAMSVLLNAPVRTSGNAR